MAGSDIREMIKKYGKRSPEVKKVTDRVLQTAKRKFVSCKKCWIAFEDANSDEPVVVVEHRGRPTSTDCINGFRVVFRNNDCKSRKNAVELGVTINNSLKLNKRDQQRAIAALKNIDKELMDNHSNIRFLNIGGIYLKETKRYTPCIVVCVSMKGLTPFFEKPLPQTTDAGIPLTVYEDTFEEHTSLPAYRKHERLIMGCKIAGVERKNKNRSVNIVRSRGQPSETENVCTNVPKEGTLGAFVRYRIEGEEKTGLLTAAHVVVPEAKRLETREWGSRQRKLDGTVPSRFPVFQPDIPIDYIGRVRWYYYDAHYCDVALVELLQDDRLPRSGLFPDSRGSFHVQRPLQFTSGQVILDPNRDVLTRDKYFAYKYGSRTGLSKGMFMIPGRCRATSPEDQETVDTIFISGCNEMAFSAKGDSGAIVFAGKEKTDAFQNDKLYAIGILEGGFEGTNQTLVIPLKRVFEKFRKFFNTEIKLVRFFGEDCIPPSIGCKKRRMSA